MITKYLFLILVSFGAVSCQKPKEEAPTVMVIFGATGDLTAKKILPAIDQLAGEGRLPGKFAVVGVARKAEEEFRKQFVFGQPLYYNQASFEEDSGYEILAQLLNQIDREFGAKSNRIYYLATQPSYFALIVEKLAQHNLINQSRVMIEKPFGHDLESALALQEKLSHFLDESQIYRIDHYLGKEGVQNLIDFRFRGDLELRWNNRHIDHIQITLSEEIGVGTRAKFWEETGLLRDVVQNHVMQLLSLVAMDLGDDIPREKIKALEAARPIESLIRGQYVGYLQEKGVPASSKVETFAAGKLFINNGRWKGIPFTIRSGKRLATSITEVIVTFKTNEVLHIRIQPKPAIFFEDSSPMTFKPFLFSEAYQKLIYDCIHGERSSFVQKEEQFAAWRILQPALDSQDEPITYPAGSLPDWTNALQKEMRSVHHRQ